MRELIIKGIFNDELTGYEDKYDKITIQVDEEQYERLSKIYPQDEINKN